MKQNMGTFDRLLRVFIVAPAAIVLTFTVFGAWSVLGVVALVVAGIAFATGATGICPGYLPFGISTRGGISTHGHSRFGGHSGIVVQH